MRLDIVNVTAKLAEDFSTLEFEVIELDRIFKETQFLGHLSNLPNAHHGYLMVCLSKIDLLSAIWSGQVGSRGQTQRMMLFMEKYLYPGKSEEQGVAVQMFRHTLMHTGSLRFLYSRPRDAKYTWRVYWSSLPSHYTHFTITQEDAQYQDILGAINVTGLSTNPSFRALNISILQFAKDLRNAASSYVTDLLTDLALQSRYEKAMGSIEIQKVN